MQFFTHLLLKFEFDGNHFEDQVVKKHKSKFSILGIGKRYYTVVLLIARLSMHIFQVPSFLGTNNVGTTNGLTLAWINCFSSKLSTCFCIFHVPSDSFDNEVNLANLHLKLSQ